MAEQRTIRIKGTGRAKAVPNSIVLNLSLLAAHKDYTETMSIGARQLEELQKCVESVGFEKDNLKTKHFSVDAKYEQEERREKGRTVYHDIFIGYECKHKLQLSFDKDLDKLRKVMETIGKCTSLPKISIEFTVKDADAMRDEVLRSAAEDAHRKAKILCAASGIKLGKLLYIDYSWDEIEISHSLSLHEDCVCYGLPSGGAGYDFSPDDVEAEDTVGFLWEIE